MSYNFQVQIQEIFHTEFYICQIHGVVFPILYNYDTVYLGDKFRVPYPKEKNDTIKMNEFM